MKKYLISIFLYLAGDKRPVLLAEQEYYDSSLNRAREYLEYQFENEPNITIAIKEIK